MWKILQQKMHDVQWDSQTLQKPKKKSEEETGQETCLSIINIGRVQFMELANVKGWNFL